MKKVKSLKKTLFKILDETRGIAWLTSIFIEIYATLTGNIKLFGVSFGVYLIFYMGKSWFLKKVLKY